MHLPLIISIFLPLYASAGNQLGCPFPCHCDDNTLIVKCEDSKLDVIPITLNPAIQMLVLKNNRIKTVDAAFQFYPDLKYVDLSNNSLVQIPTKSLLHQEKLQELRLHKNKLSIITNRTFEGLKSLAVLNLRENFLQEIARGAFSILTKLEELNLGKNQISTIDPLAFEGLANLRVLYLDDNLLSVLPSSSFPSINALAELHVGLNAFYSLPDHAFKNLSKLSILDLSIGSVTNISKQAFTGLVGLRSLNLAGNILKEVPTLQLSYLIRLEELIIGQNDFTTLEKNSFKGLTKLKKIDITGSKNLKHVRSGTFSENMNLETISLVSNPQLEKLDDGVLVGLPKLKTVMLQDNAIKSLSESVVSWNELRELDLSYNPLHCDCQLLWLLKLANQRNFTNVQCVTPVQLHDQPLKSLSSENLGCSFGDRTQQVIIVTFCVCATILLLVLGLFFFKYRSNVRNALKDYKFNKRTVNDKEREYQNNFSDEEYTLWNNQLPIKHIPITDLDNIKSSSDLFSLENEELRTLGPLGPSGTLPVRGFTYVRSNDGCRVHSFRTLDINRTNIKKDYHPPCPVHIYSY